MKLLFVSINFKRKFRKFSVKFKKNILFLQRKGVRITIIPNPTSPIATKPTKKAKNLLGSVTFFKVSPLFVNLKIGDLTEKDKSE